MPRGVLLPRTSECIGMRIVARRKELNISQRTLAKRVNICRPTLSYYENGTVPITVEKLILIAGALEKPIAFFLEGLDRTR